MRSRCPICGRRVYVFRDPTYGRVLAGHRTTMPHTPRTPWCSGGGRPVRAVRR